jgi:hypothetical protein
MRPYIRRRAQVARCVPGGDRLGEVAAHPFRQPSSCDRPSVRIESPVGPQPVGPAGVVAARPLLWFFVLA